MNDEVNNINIQSLKIWINLLGRERLAEHFSIIKTLN